MRPVIEDSTTLVARTFGVSRGLLVATPDLLARQGEVKAPDELGRLDTVAMSAVDDRAQFRLEGPGGKVHIHAHSPRYLADDLATLRFAVLQGVGASVLPDYMCRADLQSGRLLEVLPQWGPAPAITHVVFPARRALVPAVRRLIDFLAEHMNSDEPHALSGIK